jgi:hypothetical protein
MEEKTPEWMETLAKLEKTVAKLEIGQERINDKLGLLMEVQQMMHEQNQRQHKEIISLLGGDIDNIKNIVSRYLAE